MLNTREEGHNENIARAYDYYSNMQATQKQGVFLWAIRHRYYQSVSFSSKENILVLKKLLQN